jgi:TATA-box binding protein (TBP) (component of TFIID and TFIIIB)
LILQIKYKMESKYKVSTITLTCNIPDTKFNLYDISTSLSIDNTIIGIKYFFGNQKIIKGIYTDSKKPVKSFNNQMTLKYKFQNKIINIKVFFNGSFHFTGAPDSNTSKKITYDLYKLFIKLKIKMPLEVSQDTNNICIDKNNIIYNSSNVSFGYKLDKLDNNYTINSKNYTFNKTRNVFIAKTMVKKVHSILDINGNYIGLCKFNLLKYQRFYNNINVSIDFDNEIIKFRDKIIGQIEFTYDNNTNNDNNTQFKLQDIVTNINCINIVYRVPFVINRNLLTRNLLKNGYIVSYNPEIYSGVKLKIPTENNDNMITFLIFESGSIIGSNFKNESDISLYIDKLSNLLTTFQTTFQKS